MTPRRTAPPPLAAGGRRLAKLARRLRGVRLQLATALLPLLLVHRPPGTETPVTTVDAGSVVTVGVSFAADGEERLARYRIEPRPGVRVLGPLSGVVEWRDGAAPLLPVTFVVGRDEKAGMHLAAVVKIERTNGEMETVEIRIDVRKRYRLQVELRVDPGDVAPNGSTALGYRIVNRGNAVDTVALQVASGPGWGASGVQDAIVIPSGAEVVGSVRVSAPASAQVGERQVVRLTALGRGGAESTAVDLLVVSEPAWLPGLAHLPATLFVGVGDVGSGELGASQLGLGLHASGALSARTTASLDYGRAPARGGAMGMRSQLAGDHLRFHLRNPDWSAALGNVNARPSRLVGTYLSGQGVDLRVGRSGTGAELFVARPYAFAGEESGHLVQARGGVRTPLGTVGLMAADLVSPAGQLRLGTRTQSAGLSYELPEAGAHSLSAEAGLVRLTDRSGAEVTGPAAFGEYALRGRSGFLTARGRWSPVSLPGTSSAGNDASISASTALFGGLHAEGWVFRHSYPTVGEGGRGPTMEGGTMGLRFQRSRATLGVRGNHTSSSSPSPFPTGVQTGVQQTVQRSVVSSLHLPLGPLSLDGTTEFGVVERNAVPAPLRNYRAILSWDGGVGNGWASTSYSDPGLGPAALRADLGATLRLSALELELGGGAPLQAADPRRELSLWSSLALNVTRKLAIVIGAERQPWQTPGSAWQLALGIRQRISLPLPVPEFPLLQGVVFEDLNGNRTRDPGEPGVAGIALLLGPTRAVTDGRGRFAFAAASGGHQLMVDAATLRSGMIVPPDARFASAGRVEIPVVRTASVRVAVTLAPGSGSTGVAREGAARLRPAAGALVTLIDADERQREAVADESGAARADALAPGRYTLRVAHVPGLDRPIQPYEMEIVLLPGEERTLVVEIPYSPREVRFSQTAEAAPPGSAAQAPRPPTRSPLEEARRVMEELGGAGGRGTGGEVLRRFEAEYAPRYPDPAYAAGVRSHLLERLERLEP